MKSLRLVLRTPLGCGPVFVIRRLLCLNKVFDLLQLHLNELSFFFVLSSWIVRVRKAVDWLFVQRLRLRQVPKRHRASVAELRHVRTGEVLRDAGVRLYKLSGREGQQCHRVNMH